MLIGSVAASAMLLLHRIVMVLLLACRVVQHSVQVLGCRARPRALVRGRPLDHRALLIRQLASAAGLTAVTRPAAPTLRQQLRVSGIGGVLCIGLSFLLVEQPAVVR